MTTKPCSQKCLLRGRRKNRSFVLLYWCWSSKTWNLFVSLQLCFEACMHRPSKISFCFLSYSLLKIWLQHWMFFVRRDEKHKPSISYVSICYCQSESVCTAATGNNKYALMCEEKQFSRYQLCQKNNYPKRRRCVPCTNKWRCAEDWSYNRHK